MHVEVNIQNKTERIAVNYTYVKYHRGIYVDALNRDKCNTRLISFGGGLVILIDGDSCYCSPANEDVLKDCGFYLMEDEKLTLTIKEK